MSNFEIIHFSDLHVGSKDFNEGYMTNCINYINEVKPDVAICTGDLAHKGRVHQFKRAKEFLDKIEVPLLIVPGNHDHKNNGIIFFEEFFFNRRWCKVIGDFLIIGLRSGQDGTAEGELGDELLSWAMHMLRKHKDVKYRVVALHHHLVNVPSAGVKRSSLVDSGNALEIMRYFNVDLVLMGHRHVSHVWNVDGMALLYSGTSGSDKVRGRDKPSFNHIKIDLEHNETVAHIVDCKKLKKTMLLHRVNNTVIEYEDRDTNLEHILKYNIFDD